MSTMWETSAVRLVEGDYLPYTFTAEDVTAIIGYPDPTHKANATNNRIGRVFVSLAKQGKIEPVGFRRSSSKTRNGGVIRVWRRV